MHPLTPHRRERPARTALAGALALLTLAGPPAASANPHGGVVRGGIASITGQGTSRVDVTQRSQGAVLSWEHFDIAPGEVTNFHQPNANATAINRILQQDPSKILGSLNANGNVYLINPNGFLFGATAKIDTHSFAAMTSIDAEDLKKLSGGFDASAQSAPGAKIENHGAISAGDGGFVYLIAPRVENGKDAVITTPQGEVLLAAGATVTLTDDPTGIGLGVRYTAPGEPGGEAVNLGKLVANGGFARMRAELVRQGGVVQANAVRERAGKIELYATNTLAIESGSVTDASGGAGAGAGGEISAKSEGDAHMDGGALVDVSGGAAGGDGGTAELSAAGTLALGGTLRAGAKAGSKHGSIVIDPEILEIGNDVTIPNSDVNLRISGAVDVKATERIEVASNATIDLADDTQAGDGSAERQSLTLRSGGDISFGRGAKIVDDGSGAQGQKIWDVNLVAGADLGSGDVLALKSGSHGSIYLSGGRSDLTTGKPITLGTNDGEVSLTHGNLTVRAADHLVVGNGGGLKDQTGQIDIAIGGDLSFRARRDVDESGNPIDGVIENGSGDISIVAGGSVDLVESPNTSGNAAIRTRGVAGTDAQSQTTISNGGSITIQAGGDVDAGVGNRWLEPGPNFTPQEYADQVAQLPADLAPPPGYAPPSFDPMPVVRAGILGIGTEAGGDITIVAGGSVRTGASSVTRSGASAAGLGTLYNGSHIGIFGLPIARAIDYVNGVVRNALIPGAPEGKLTVVAGDAIEGDFVARNGQAEFRAGYALARGQTARTLDPANLDAALVESDPAKKADMTHGWFGTLARPVTVDLIDASVTGVGRNGVAIRAIENPSLVYPPSAFGTSAVPTWRPTDFAKLRSPDGDVILVGNDISMPTAGSSVIAPNNLVRVLPPNVSIETDRGDLVLLNDFLIYPSERGGLELNVAGTVRTADFSASTNAVLALALYTAGATGDRSFNLPTGTRLRDPVSGSTYTLTNTLIVNPREPAAAAQGKVTFQLSPDAASGAFTVPAGTLVKTADGRLYQVLSDAVLPPPQQRLSQGRVTFFVSGTGASSPIRISNGTPLIGPDGTRFVVTQDGTIDVGQTQITLAVAASADAAGIDAPAFGLSLATPIPGIARGVNLLPTTRPAVLTAGVIAVDVGDETNAFPLAVGATVGKIPGVESVTNFGQLGGGADLAPFGTGKSVVSSLTTGFAPLVKANVLGPAGELRSGTQLVIDDPSVLPPGVPASDFLITVDAVAVGASVTPTLYRKLTPDGSGQLRPDPEPGTVASVSQADTWIRDGGGVSARIKQSDAAPNVDERSTNGSFDYFAYLSSCRSGVACGDLELGTAPTHADDPDRASLRALGGFDRVQIELAKPAFVLSGDPGPDGLFGTEDDGADGSLVDFALLAQNNKPTDETVVWAPIGNATLGAVPPAPGVAPDPFSGLQVAGPGSAKFLIGVLPNAPQLDLNGNGKIDPEESTGDRNGDGQVDLGEWRGSPAVFTHLDESQRTVSLASSGPIFSSRLVLPGAGDHSLTPAEAPYVPSGSGGAIQLAGAFASGLGAELPLSLGLQTIGNVRDPVLPLGSANLSVVADQEIALGARGSIETYQGGRLFVESVSAGLSAGVPPSGFQGRRGIVTLFRGPGFRNAPADPTGGGPIGIDVDGDFNIGGLALAALSASDITVYSRDGSIDAGVSTPFSSPNVFVDAGGVVNVSYEGGGIFAGGGNLGLFVKKEVRIGAGITGNTINIVATDVSGGGTGAIHGTNVDISATGTISGTISASGSINVSGGATSQGASLSAGGIVSGAGAGVGSNSGSGKVSSELNDLGDRAAQIGAAGFQTAHALATEGHHGVVIQVTSRVIGEPEAGSEDSKKHR